MYLSWGTYCRTMGSMVRTLANCTSGMYKAHTTWAQPVDTHTHTHTHTPHAHTTHSPTHTHTPDRTHARTHTHTHTPHHTEVTESISTLKFEEGTGELKSGF